MMSDEDAASPAAEKVGYKSPPKSGQFRKGKSGNIRGRPRKFGNDAIKAMMLDSRPLEEAVARELFREIAITTDGQTEQVTVLTALLRSAFSQALKGRQGAMTNVVKLVSQTSERINTSPNKPKPPPIPRSKLTGAQIADMLNFLGLYTPDYMEHRKRNAEMARRVDENPDKYDFLNR
jgi:hypothetical protein